MSDQLPRPILPLVPSSLIQTTAFNGNSVHLLSPIIKKQREELSAFTKQILIRGKSFPPVSLLALPMSSPRFKLSSSIQSSEITSPSINESSKVQSNPFISFPVSIKAKQSPIRSRLGYSTTIPSTIPLNSPENLRIPLTTTTARTTQLKVIVSTTTESPTFESEFFELTKQKKIIDVSEPTDDIYFHSSSWLTTGSGSGSSTGSSTRSTNSKTQTNQNQDNKEVFATDELFRSHHRLTSSSDNSSYDGFRSFISSTDSFSVDKCTGRMIQTDRQPRYGRRSGDDGSRTQSWKSRDSTCSNSSIDNNVDSSIRTNSNSTSSVLGRAGLQISSASQNVSLGSSNPLSVGIHGKSGVWSSLQPTKSSSYLRRYSIPACVPVSVPRLHIGTSAAPLPSSLNSSPGSHPNHGSSSGVLDPSRVKSMSFQDEFENMVWSKEGKMSLTWRELLAELPNTT